MAIGFKVADGYVEVHARYDKGELRRAAENAADDNDRAYNKERERNSRSGPTRETNRRIGRQANEDFVRGVREQASRQRESPFIRVDDVKRDASRLGRVHVREFAKEADREVDRRRSLFHRIGARIAQRIKTGLTSRESVGNIAGAFLTRFIELVSFGQADVGMSRVGGKWAAWGARLGVLVGGALAGALVLKIAEAVTALTPLLLGGLIAALPIIAAIKSGLRKEDGKWKTRANEMGRALRSMIDHWTAFKKAIAAPFKPVVLGMLHNLGGTLELLQKPFASLAKTLGPSFGRMFEGALRGVLNFVTGLKAAMPGVTAGLRQWGVELPKIGKALAAAFATLMKNPQLVKNAVKGLSGLIQGLVKFAAGLVTFLTYALGAWNNLWRLADVGWRIFSKWIGLPGILGKISHALAPLKKALSDAWEAFKKFASASNDRQALERFKVLLHKIKAVWETLKPILAKAWHAAWDKIKEIWNTKVKPWVDGTLKPWLAKHLRAAARAGFKALEDEAKRWLKSLPGKAKAALAALPGKISGEIEKAKDRAVQKVKDLVSRVVTFLKGLPGKAASAVHSLWSRMSGAFTSMISNAVAKGRSMVTRFIAAITSLPSKAAAVARRVKGAVQGALAGAGSWLISAGKSIMQGLANGISAGYNAVVGAIKRVASAAVAAAKSALKIGSPSKVFADEVGVPVAQGIGMGAERQMPKEFKRIRSLVPSVTGAREGGGSDGRSYHTTSNWNPTIHVHVQAGLETVNSAVRRALTKDIFLALEQYRKDYVDR